jgi:tetratricopeptide (TPR) repeat protein
MTIWTGRLEEAIAECEAAIELVETVFDNGKAPDTAMHSLFAARLIHRNGLRDLARYRELQGKQADAVDTYRRAIDAEALVVRDVPRSLVHESPNPLYDAFISLSRQIGQSQQVEQLLEAELATWQELEDRSAFKESCQLRQLENQLRLAEHLLACERAQEAAPYYRQACSFLDAFDGEVHKAIAICVHVCPAQPQAALPECPERNELLAAVQKRLLSAITEAREESPDEKWELWGELALAYYGPLQWQGAEKEARLAMEMAANDPPQLAKIVPLLLLAGETEEYQGLCQRVLESPPHQRGQALQGALHLCLLDPDSPDPEKLLELARSAAQGLSDTLLLHVALYRAGEYLQAIHGLESDLASGRHPRALVELHLALANSLAKDNEQAQAWVEKGIAHWEPYWAPRDKLSYEVLRQEVNQRIPKSDDTPTEEAAADDRDTSATSPATAAE